ncbi:sialidase family protein [Neobacillus vireti]|uniref:sialidase family protein n=1 Tax=Neobacillus vireti TaxID=220686 RepID=UPI003000648A
MAIEKFTISKDNNVYEAFPRVALTAAGNLICAFTECNHHGDRSYTRIVYTISTDRGRTWGEKLPLTESTEGLNYYYDCVGLTRLNDGRLVVVVNMSNHSEGFAQGNYNQSENVLYFGDVEGNNWVGPIKTPVTGIVPDNLLELNSGRWIITTHKKSKQHEFLEQQLWYSDNQGTDWIGPITVASKEGLHLCEASILTLSDGTLVAYLRENSGEGWDGFKAISKDYGETWDGPYRVPLPGCHRPVAGRLQNGNVLITYRFMQGGKGWLGYWTQNLFAALTDEDSAKAENRNEQWSRILPIDFDRSLVSDTGYSDWIQFDDGEIYIVNYIVDDAPKAYIRGYAVREDDFLFKTK